MKICKNGHTLSDDTQYCPYCGVEVTESDKTVHSSSAANHDYNDQQEQVEYQQQQGQYQQGQYQQGQYQQEQYYQQGDFEPENVPLTGYRGPEREPLTVLLLGIITCGIYLIYWRYVTSQDINRILGYEKTKPSFELWGILCGILSIINWYYIDEAMMEIDRKRGKPSDSKFILWLLLSILAGLGTFFMAYTVQERLNSLYSGTDSKTVNY